MLCFLSGPGVSTRPAQVDLVKDANRRPVLPMELGPSRVLRERVLFGGFLIKGLDPCVERLLPEHRLSRRNPLVQADLEELLTIVAEALVDETVFGSHALEASNLLEVILEVLAA